MIELSEAEKNYCALDRERHVTRVYLDEVFIAFLRKMNLSDPRTIKKEGKVKVHDREVLSPSVSSKRYYIDQHILEWKLRRKCYFKDE